MEESIVLLAIHLDAGQEIEYVRGDDGRVVNVKLPVSSRRFVTEACFLVPAPDTQPQMWPHYVAPASISLQESIFKVFVGHDWVKKVKAVSLG